MAIYALGMGNQQTMANQVIQIANVSELLSPAHSVKFIRPQTRLRSKRPIFLQLSVRRKGNLVPSTLIFAVSNEGDEPESTSSKACFDNQLFITPNSSESYEDLQNVEVVSSEGKFVKSAEHVRNEGSLLEKLKAVQLHVLASEQWNASRLKLCNRRYSTSATNLIHYLALKCLDFEQLKEDLSSFGLLNLETINSYVLAGLTAGIEILENLKTNSLNTKEFISVGTTAQKLLDKQRMREYNINSMRRKASSNRELLLGSLRDERATHIMVTVGQEATESETLVNDLLKMGASIIRINCAHGDPSTWSEIIRRVRRNSQMLEKPCKILMDLAGPKLRTGKFQAGPRVMKISPKKNASGSIIFPAQVWLSHRGAGSPPAHLSPDATVIIDSQEFLGTLQVGDTMRFCDSRGKKRMLKIFHKYHVFGGTGFMAECTTTAYIQSGTVLRIKGKKGKFSVGQVVDVPPAEQFVRLRAGDLLIISRDSSSEQKESNEPMVGAHRVTCHSGYLFDSVKPGDPIAFDDGKIWGIIKGNSMSEIIVSITHARPKGTKLGSEKSINIPESSIRFEGLTSKDLMDLEFVAAHADMVGISFVRDTGDIIVLRQELEKQSFSNLGIVLKIETKSGFEKLPLMLLEAMKSPNPLGVMIARGDLAVECGWERLADIQEQILSICGAAHIPVIWATQVLESLVKFGVPTRAEITDVASGSRASCIMLNKGEHIVKAVSTLDTILHNNSTKMKAELKPLVLSSRLFH